MVHRSIHCSPVPDDGRTAIYVEEGESKRRGKAYDVTFRPGLFALVACRDGLVQDRPQSTTMTKSNDDQEHAAAAAVLHHPD